MNTWWLSEVFRAGQITQGDAIKDRYSMQFRPSGSYVQTLLSDGTVFEGTWMLMGADNRTLHLTDHKGAIQEYSVAVSSESLTYGRNTGTGQAEHYGFRMTR
ncbi:hypothetical protein [Hymenobacter sp. IS2118]|uniref:hypothetical protein n=1 Tax=Hymenobacter sp. IS2118 TaxID=1505605 RepID=UPI00054E87B4|nr:hypothetical protein [Hymenobacter sp. IS2118]